MNVSTPNALPFSWQKKLVHWLQSYFEQAPGGANTGGPVVAQGSGQYYLATNQVNCPPAILSNLKSQGFLSSNNPNVYVVLDITASFDEQTCDYPPCCEPRYPLIVDCYDETYFTAHGGPNGGFIIGTANDYWYLDTYADTDYGNGIIVNLVQSAAN